MDTDIFLDILPIIVSIIIPILVCYWTINKNRDKSKFISFVLRSEKDFVRKEKIIGLAFFILVIIGYCVISLTEFIHILPRKDQKSVFIVSIIIILYTLVQSMLNKVLALMNLKFLDRLIKEKKYKEIAIAGKIFSVCVFFLISWTIYLPTKDMYMRRVHAIIIMMIISAIISLFYCFIAIYVKLRTLFVVNEINIHVKSGNVYKNVFNYIIKNEMIMLTFKENGIIKCCHIPMSEVTSIEKIIDTNHPRLNDFILN